MVLTEALKYKTYKDVKLVRSWKVVLGMAVIVQTIHPRSDLVHLIRER